jgi:hypothetical protein
MDGRFPTSDTPADDLGQLNDPTSNTFLVEHLCVWACLLGLGDNKCDCKSGCVVVLVHVLRTAG